MASETEKYSRLAESLIKQLTGGDAVTARFLNQNPFTFTPRFLLQVAGNYKPAILSQDHGIWRRVKLIPWEARFDGASRVPRHVMDTKIQAEAEGILAWAVRGAMEWYAEGAGEPATVASTTQDYRESEDRLAEFISARLVQGTGPDYRVAPMAVRRTYAEWAEDAGLSRKEVLSGWALGVELESRGFAKAKRSGKWGFDGVRLATDAEQHAARAAAEMTPTAAEPDEEAPADIFGQAREETAA
jgi:putative DNA primase/helicase